MKKYIIPVAAFIAGMAIVPGAFADGSSTAIETIDKLAECAAEAKVATCTYAGDEANLHFKNGHQTIGITKSVTIDLGGKKMNMVLL